MIGTPTMTGMPHRLAALSPRSIVAAIVNSRLDSVFSNASDTSMPDKWPSLYEQINAVLAAPIPFFLAVIVVAVIVWRGGEWLYRSGG